MSVMSCEKVPAHFQRVFYTSGKEQPQRRRQTLDQHKGKVS